MKQKKADIFLFRRNRTARAASIRMPGSILSLFLVEAFQFHIRPDTVDCFMMEAKIDV
jgi:hypothetical protein